MLSSTRRWLILAAVMLAYLPIVLDMTILHIAVPSLTLALEATGTEVLWVIDIYPLLMAGLLVPMGTLADRLGHRKVLLWGLVVFGAASLAAAFSTTAAMLIVSRGGLALGGAMITPTVLALIRSTFEDARERALALGMWGTVSSAGAALGPLVGGGLLEHFWWGSVFFINAPVVLLVWPLVYLLVPRHHEPTTERWTIGQALVLVTGLIAVVYAIKAGTKPNASLPLVIIISAIGLVLLAGFVIKQKRAQNPMLDLSLFAKPPIRTGLIMALVVAGALIGVELTIAQELQYVVGLTPFQAGMFMLPLMAASAIGGPVAGALVVRFGLRYVASASLLAATLGLTGLGISDFKTADIMITGYMGLLGFALSVGLTASSIAIMGSAPVAKAGAAGALEAGGYELGAGLGITGFGVLLTGMYQAALRIPQDLAASLPGNAEASIGETLVAAEHLGGAQGEMLGQAARAAFASAHQTVLLSSALLVGLLAVFVLFSLRSYRDPESARTH